jgi:4-methyl-5(b-hydroxyethyl)-thiazole monophosphate biosynthesis
MPGAERLSKSEALQELLAAQNADQRWLAAICAAPAVVLQTAGFLSGRRATAHPAFVDKLGDSSCDVVLVIFSIGAMI